MRWEFTDLTEAGVMAVLENGVLGFRAIEWGSRSFAGVFGSGVAEAAAAAFLLVVTIAVSEWRQLFSFVSNSPLSFN
ncbi:hypothetical protein ACFXTH_031859 [Malus domestica]